MEKITFFTTDVIVIGNGVAGLSAAISARKQGKDVLLFCFGDPASSRASGFNAIMDHRDTPVLFFKDTFISGKEICDPLLLVEFSCFANHAIDLLKTWNINLFEDAQAKIRLSGGSSVPRTIYATGEKLGYWLVNQLKGYTDELGVKKINYRVIDIKKSNNTFCVEGYSREGRVICKSKVIIIASGGLGQLYGYTTNSLTSLGDGFIFALNLGAHLIDMEFTQFEPFIMFGPGPCRGRGVPINLVADSAKIINGKGCLFLPELSQGIRSFTKDELAKMIANEVLEGRGSANGCVYCNLSGAENEMSKYPNFLTLCHQAGINPKDTLIEVFPAFHCIMGGIRSDVSGNAHVDGLFVAGEVMGGVHGANRLGSNGFIDALCFGVEAGVNAVKYMNNSSGFNMQFVKGRDYDQWYQPSIKQMENSHFILDEIQSIKMNLNNIMSNHVGLLRKKEGLSNAIYQIEKLKEGLDTFNDMDFLIKYKNLQKLLELGLIIAQSALRREESRGVHYRQDFPNSKKIYKGNFVVRKENNQFHFGFLKREYDEINWE